MPGCVTLYLSMHVSVQCGYLYKSICVYSCICVNINVPSFFLEMTIRYKIMYTRQLLYL